MQANISNDTKNLKHSSIVGLQGIIDDHTISYNNSKAMQRGSRKHIESLYTDTPIITPSHSTCLERKDSAEIPGFVTTLKNLMENYTQGHNAWLTSDGSNITNT